MKMVVVSVRDAKSEAFGRPIFVSTIGAAIRSFGDEVNRDERENVMCTHPEDFQLFHLGYYEDSIGQFENITPKLLAQGNEMFIGKISKV